MKASELRIGNLIQVDDVVNTVLSIDNEGVMVEPIGDYTHLIDMDRKHELEPIPLTEEWLFKFGFEKVGDSFFKGFELFIDGGNFFYGLRDEGQMDLHLKYVHQLQNWYHTLTGEELTLNNPVQ